MDNESNVLVSNQKQIREANEVLLSKTEGFSEGNIIQAKSIYKRVLSSSTNDNAMSTVTARKMLRLLEVLENYLVGAHRNNKADIHNVADVLYYNRFYFNDCYKDLIEELDEAIFYWYDKAAILGSASAYLKRARFYLYGYGVKQSVIEALDSYKQASEGSKDAWTIWTSVKNNESSLRDDLADEINVVKFYLFSEGLCNNDIDYKKDFEKAKEIISNLKDSFVAKSLTAVLAKKNDSNKINAINGSIVALSKEYEELKYSISKINEEISEAKKLKQDVDSRINNAKNDAEVAQNRLDKINLEITDKENIIVSLDKKLEKMEIEERSLLESCNNKRQELTSLEDQISLLGQKYEKMASDCAVLEMKYGVLNEFKEVEVTSPGVIEFMNKAQKGDKDSLYKYALCLKHGIGVKKNIELAEKYIQMLISG